VSSPFDVLGIEPGADEEEVTRAYRRRVKEVHPDQGGSAEAFQAVREAYELLQENPDASAPTVDLDADPDESEASTPDEEPTHRVEYLNYEVLEDYGWSLTDPDLFEKAAGAGLDGTDYGRFVVEPRETLLEAAENRGFAWPYACRGGACANCAVAVVEGRMESTIDNVLPPEMIERGIRLSCIGAPITADARVVFNVKHLPDLDDLRLPADRFEGARPTD